jgi:hypothetical protein
VCNLSVLFSFSIEIPRSNIFSEQPLSESSGGSWGANTDEDAGTNSSAQAEVGSWVTPDATATTTEATTEGSWGTPDATTTTPTQPAVADEDDEGFGKKTLAEYEKEKAAQAEALAKLVGKVEKRTELEKKIDVCAFFKFMFSLS